MCQVVLYSNTTSHLQPLDAGIIKTFKAYYWQSQLQCLIICWKMTRSPTLTLKEAIRYLALAWKTVSATSIANYWRHTGITGSSGGREEDSKGEGCMQALPSSLAHEHLSSSECMSAASYIHADASLETEDLPLDDDIISMVTGQDDADIEDIEEVNEEDSRDPVPTLEQALQAAWLLQNHLASTVGNEDDTG